MGKNRATRPLNIKGSKVKTRIRWAFNFKYSLNLIKVILETFQRFFRILQQIHGEAIRHPSRLNLPSPLIEGFCRAWLPKHRWLVFLGQARSKQLTGPKFQGCRCLRSRKCKDRAYRGRLKLLRCMYLQLSRDCCSSVLWAETGNTSSWSTIQAPWT